jgi:hypothetical protein
MASDVVRYQGRINRRYGYDSDSDSSSSSSSSESDESRGVGRAGRRAKQIDTETRVAASRAHLSPESSSSRVRMPARTDEQHGKTQPATHVSGPARMSPGVIKNDFLQAQIHELQRTLQKSQRKCRAALHEAARYKLLVDRKTRDEVSLFHAIACMLVCFVRFRAYRRCCCSSVHCYMIVVGRQLAGRRVSLCVCNLYSGAVDRWTDGATHTKVPCCAEALVALP